MSGLDRSEGGRQICVREGGGGDFCMKEGGGSGCGETNPKEGFEFWFLMARRDLKHENEK
jgi:hypothetical protein